MNFPAHMASGGDYAVADSMRTEPETREEVFVTEQKVGKRTVISFFYVPLCDEVTKRV